MCQVDYLVRWVTSILSKTNIKEWNGSISIKILIAFKSKGAYKSNDEIMIVLTA